MRPRGAGGGRTGAHLSIQGTLGVGAVGRGSRHGLCMVYGAFVVGFVVGFVVDWLPGSTTITSPNAYQNPARSVTDPYQTLTRSLPYLHQTLTRPLPDAYQMPSRPHPWGIPWGLRWGFLGGSPRVSPG